MSRSAPPASPSLAPSEQATRPAWRPTWWMLLASLTALLALCNIDPARRSVAPLILIPLIAASYVLPYRLRRDGPLRWFLRVCLFLMVLLNAPERTQSTNVWYLDPGVTAMLGLLAGVELLLQHWLGEPGGLRHGVMLWLTAAIFACATSTMEPYTIPYLAPAYALSAAGIIRVFRPPGQAPQSAAPFRAHWRPAVFKGAAVVLAMLLGLGLTIAVQQTREALNRIGASWLTRLAASPRSVGMNSADQLEHHYNLFASTARALLLRGTQTAMHLRGMVFDEYLEGGTWTPRLEQRLFDSMPPLLAVSPPQNAIEVVRLEDSLNLLYLPLNAARMQPDGHATVQLERGHRTVMTAISEIGGVCNYRFEPGASLNGQGPLCRTLSPQERAACLAIPAALEEEVREIARGLGDAPPLLTVQLVVRYLHQNHEYTLETEIRPGEPLKDFLAHPGRKAHCQFFASAAVMLLRARGIPARYVTGYYAHEVFGDHEIVVRQRDAHAWTEAWIDGVGWMTVDATPASSLPAEQVGALHRWREKILDLFTSAMAWMKQIEWRLVALSGVSLVFGALMLQSLLTILRRRRPGATRAYAFPGEELRQISTEFSMLLRRVGEPPLESATWSEYLTNQAEQTSTRRSRRHLRLKAAADFVAVYNRIRFGDPDSPAALSELRRHLKHLKESSS